MPKVLIAALALVLAAPAEAEMYRGTETPDYKVERKVGGSELREYGPTVVAEVTVQGSRSGAANAGFRVLAGYIFGGNAAQEKIAMTTPVAQVPQGDITGGEWTVRFTLPAGSTLATLPRPDDPRVRFLQTDARQMLVTTFSGVPTQSALETALASLKADARTAGLTVAGPPEYMFYDPPLAYAVEPPERGRAPGAMTGGRRPGLHVLQQRAFGDSRAPLALFQPSSGASIVPMARCRG